MSYTYRLYSSVEHVDPSAWEEVQRCDPSPQTDLRFLRVIERTLQDQATCWPLQIDDEQGRPVAVAVLCEFQMDGIVLAGPIIRWVAGQVRRVRPQFLRPSLLIGGVPVSTGESAMALRDDADLAKVTRSLAEALAELQEKVRAKLTLVKEFTDEQAEQFAGLEAVGYLRVPSLPMHEFPPIYADFEDYHRQRSRRSRHNIRKSRKKLEAGGIQVKHLRGVDGALDYLNEDVQSLYHAVYEKSKTKVEYLPLEFFRELARQLPEEAWYTFFLLDDRVVAFSLRIAYADVVDLVYLGIDYDLNRKYDLYFNVLYEDLDGALRLRPRMIHFGQNSSQVKLRIGCRQSARSMFIQGHGIWGPLVRTFSRFIFREVALQSAAVSEPRSREENREAVANCS